MDAGDTLTGLLQTDRSDDPARRQARDCSPLERSRDEPPADDSSVATGVARSHASSALKAIVQFEARLAPRTGTVAASLTRWVALWDRLVVDSLRERSG